MIKIKIDKKEYLIKTSWDDVSYVFYAELKNPNNERKLLQQISFLTGIEPETVVQLSVKQLTDILELVKFMEDDIITYNKIECDKEIAKESWAKLEECKQLFQKEENPYKVIPEVVKIYTGIDIWEKPLPEVYGYVDFFLHSSIHSGKDMRG